MCTAMTLQTLSDEIFLGRTMDFSYDINPQLYIVPRSHEWNNNLNNNKMKNSYKFIGFGEELNGMFALFDGVNEKGFAAASLYFSGYAQYDSLFIHKGSIPISSVDFLHYIIGNCASVKDLPSFLEEIAIVGVPDPITNSIAPLHWITTDRSGECVVIEVTDRGIEILNNPVGVMSNSPDINWHITNLRNYVATSPIQPEEVYWNNFRMTPFGQGAGTTSLPGGFTSPERFVRLAYLKKHLPKPKNSKEAISACFHVLDNVSIPKGAVISSRNTFDYTIYTALINTNTCEYFYKTYDDIIVNKASLFNN